MLEKHIDITSSPNFYLTQIRDYTFVIIEVYMNNTSKIFNWMKKSNFL